MIQFYYGSKMKLFFKARCNFMAKYFLMLLPLLVYLKGIGTSEGVIIEILASRTKEQIKNIVKAYKEGKSA